MLRFPGPECVALNYWIESPTFLYSHSSAPIWSFEAGKLTQQNRLVCSYGA